jgi:hypothetical protein
MLCLRRFRVGVRAFWSVQQMGLSRTVLDESEDPGTREIPVQDRGVSTVSSLFKWYQYSWPLLYMTRQRGLFITFNKFNVLERYGLIYY